jgi:hypothetical protein
VRRVWPIALLIFAACGTAATPNTPKPSGAALATVPTLPSHCKLPLTESWTSGGFLVFPDGTYTSDPLSHETTDEAIKNLRTVLDPALHGPQDYSMDQPVFDARSSRWLPVPRTAVSPDGSRYAYSQYLYPGNAPVSPPPAPIGSLIRVVTIATGDDRVIYRGVPYDVVGWNPEGVYLRRPCTDAYCKGGMWLLDPAGGSLQQVAAPLSQVSGVNRVPVWSALGGGAA